MRTKKTNTLLITRLKGAAKLKAINALVFCLMLPTMVQAAPVTYNFSSVDFDWSYHTANVNGRAKIRGGTLDGFLTFDPDTLTVTDFKFDTWQPLKYNPRGISTTYDSSDPTTNTSAFIRNTTIYIDLLKYRSDRLIFEFDNLAGEPFVDVYIYERRSRFGGQGSNTPVLAINSSTVAPVPLPPTMFLFASGLLGIFGAKRFRRLRDHA